MTLHEYYIEMKRIFYKLFKLKIIRGDINYMVINDYIEEQDIFINNCMRYLSYPRLYSPELVNCFLSTKTKHYTNSLYRNFNKFYSLCFYYTYKEIIYKGLNNILIKHNALNSYINNINSFYRTNLHDLDEALAKLTMRQFNSYNTIDISGFVGCAFSWGGSNEGYNFWASISDELCKYIRKHMVIETE